METKNLPIKTFLKRDIDDRNTEGGGDVRIPQWANMSQVASKATAIISSMKNISKIIEDKKKVNDYIPTVMAVKLNPNATAKNYRESIANIFNHEEINLIGIQNDDKILIKFDNLSDLDKAQRRIETACITSSNLIIKIAIAAIDSFDSFETEIDSSICEGDTLKIKLFDYQDKSLNNILKIAFLNFCKQHKIEVENAGYISQPAIYKISHVTEDSLTTLKQFEGIRNISQMPKFECEENPVMFASDIPVKRPSSNGSYPIVGVLDSGISDISHLSPWLLPERSITHLDESDIDRNHGTAVASVIEYSDELEPMSNTENEGCFLVDFPVKDKTDFQFENEILQNVREAIKSNPDIKIWNMSIGSKSTSKTDEFSDYGIELDAIQQQYGVLICKSCGNCENYKINAPVSRIAESADSIRSLVVGSIAQAKHEYDLAEINEPSPFSRIGPGPAFLVKPELVHYGGNVGIDGSGEPTQTPVLAFNATGELSEFVGTSFSTPRITSIAANIAHKLGDSFNPLLVKALLIHSAKYPQNIEMNYADKLKYMGFGMPSNANMILHNDQNEITLIMQDTIQKGHYTEILDFPFPESLFDEDEYFKGCITVTLVTDAILDSSQGAEYCQSNINVYLGTYDSKCERDMSRSNVKNPIGAIDKKNLLNQSLYGQKVIKDTTGPFSSERMLLTYGDKFQPVKKWCVDLEEMNSSPKQKYLPSNRKWYLKLEGLFRQFTESKYTRDFETPSQDYCLIITIKDKDKHCPVYDEVTQRLNTFGFVCNDIQITESIHVESDNDD